MKAVFYRNYIRMGGIDTLDEFKDLQAAVSGWRGGLAQAAVFDSLDLGAMSRNFDSSSSSPLQAAFSQGNQSKGDMNVQLVVKLGESTLINKVIDGINQQQRAAGVTLITV
jgi:hypothetical protein